MCYDEQESSSSAYITSFQSLPNMELFQIFAVIMVIAGQAGSCNSKWNPVKTY